MKRREIKLILVVILLTLIGFLFIYDTTATRLIAKELSPYVFLQRQVIAFLIGLVFLRSLSPPIIERGKGYGGTYI